MSQAATAPAPAPAAATRAGPTGTVITRVQPKNPIKVHAPVRVRPAPKPEPKIVKIVPTHTMAEDRPIWTRQPDETDREWAWFSLYRGLSPALRSVNRSYAEYRKARGDPWTHKNAPHMLQVMSRIWSWQMRAAEFDVYIDTERNATLAMLRRQATEEVAELGKNMRKCAAIACQALFKDLYEEDSAGNIKFKARLTPAAIVRLAKAGVELERLALGMDPGKGAPAVQVNLALAVDARGRVRTDEDLLGEAAQILQARTIQKKLIEGEFDTKPKAVRAK